MTVWVVGQAGGAGEFLAAFGKNTGQLGVNVQPTQVAALAAATPSRGAVVLAFAAPTTVVPAQPPPWLSSCALVPVVEQSAHLSAFPGWFAAHNAFVRARYHPNHW